MHGCKDALFNLVLGSNIYDLTTYLKFQLLKHFSNIFHEKNRLSYLSFSHCWYASGTRQFSSFLRSMITHHFLAQCPGLFPWLVEA